MKAVINLMSALTLGWAAAAQAADGQSDDLKSSEQPLDEDSPAGFYLGAGVGLSDSDAMDESSGSARLIFGYQASSYLGVEATYEYLAGYDQEYCFYGECWDERSTISGPTIAVTGRAPLGDAVALVGKAGLFSWHHEREGVEDESGAAPFFAIGGAYRFTNSAEVDLLYSRFMLNGSDSPATETTIDGISLNLTFHF